MCSPSRFLQQLGSSSRESQSYLGKKVKIPMIITITSSCSTMQSIREPSKVVKEEHIGTTPQEGSVCVSYAQPHRMNKMLVALLIKAG